MRQEMKVGFAIGGVLLAVLVVYVLVVSSRDAHKSQQVGLDTSGPTVSFPADHADSSAKTGNTTTDTGKTSPPTDIMGTDSGLMKPDHLPAGPSTAPSIASNEPAKAPSNDPWAAALTTGSVPTMMTATPTARTASHVTPSPHTDIEILDKVNFNLGNDEAFKKPVADATTRPSGTGERTHTVATGETMSSIAAAAYGNSAYYSHIMRANPNVDPKKLKVGTVLNMPAIDDVKPSNSSSEASTPSPARTQTADFTPRKPIDDKTQYVVQSGDSLYRISVKLYGKADHVDKLAQSNVGTVGADRRLKVGQVLTLPEPPTTANH